MNREWFYFSNWELSDGNKWTPMPARGLRKAWKYTVAGGLKKIIAGPDHRMVLFAGKDQVVMLDLAGREMWRTSLFEGGPKMNEYDFPPYLVEGAWFYRETLFAKMAGVAPIQLDPVSGKVVRRSRFAQPTTSETGFDPQGDYSAEFKLIQGNWITGTGPGVYAKITRSGLLERVELDPHTIGLGWGAAQIGGRLVVVSNICFGDRLDCIVRVLIFTGEWKVFLCREDDGNTYLKIAKNGDYFGAVVIPHAVDALIASQSEYLVTKHNGPRWKWWLECRRLNDLERVLWRTEPCGWMNWFMGTGNTVWHPEWCGPGLVGKEWLIGRDLETGEEIYRKAEAARYMGLFCGPLIITASARSITAWEPIPY